MGMIFVSYRREDAAGEARALFGSLTAQLGAGSVFMDVDNIALGRDFREALHERLNDCDVLLALIGKGWLESKNRQGKPRLEDSNDFVRLEILAALKRDIPVTPVLLQDAEMPTAEQLPLELRDFAYRNAFELSHARWESDVRELVRRLGLVRQATAPAEAPPPPAASSTAQTPPAAQAASPPADKPAKVPLAAVAVAVVAVVGGGGWLFSGGSNEAPAVTAPIAAPITGQPTAQTTAPDPVIETAQSNETAPSSGADAQHMFPAGFVYCDAKLLAAHWKIDINEAKNRIGRLVNTGQKPLVDGRLKQAYDRAASGAGTRCVFSDSGYSFADAERLSKVWGVSVAQAKAMVENKLNWGGNNNIRQALQGGG